MNNATYDNLVCVAIFLAVSGIPLALDPLVDGLVTRFQLWALVVCTLAPYALVFWMLWTFGVTDITQIAWATIWVVLPLSFFASFVEGTLKKDAIIAAFLERKK